MKITAKLILNVAHHGLELKKNFLSKVLKNFVKNYLKIFLIRLYRISCPCRKGLSLVL